MNKWQGEETGSGLVPEGYPLQAALWPQMGISTEISAHFRMSGPTGLSLTKGGIDFASGGYFSTDSYYNLFNLGKWHGYCGLLPLELWLKGQGRFQLTIWLASRDRSWDRLFCEVVTLDGLLRQPFDPDQKARSNALVFFELTALEDAKLEDFTWATTMPPRHKPELVLSVTTYRRETEVMATAERFRRFRATSELRDHISMIIVDNGRTVMIPDGDGITIIPNENLGGAGGFARGLLTARDSGASHCLFMDDDASVQMEAVSRSWWFMAYALDPRTAVAGGMIDSDHRWQIWENGARFERGCKPRFAGLDLRNRDHVFHMEYETTATPPEGFYAGWWFFAFPIAQAIHLSFPFFVRGDDVSFSLANDFRIVTLPGVASIQESFTDKASPLTWYLDFRSHLAHHLSLPKKQLSWWKLQRMFISFYLRAVLRYHYDSLSAVNLAIEDVLQGPRFFDENADMVQRRNDLKCLNKTEVWQLISSRQEERLSRCARPLRALLLLTLNGHLLPFSNVFGSKLVVSSKQRDNYREIYGAQKITYLNADQTLSYVVHRDRSRFWRESLRLLKNSLRLRRKYPQILKDWQQSYSGMTSEEFWRDKFRLNSATV